MKKILVILLLFASSQITHAQINTVTGNVKDDKGNPLHYVLVADDQTNAAALTDSLGNFSLTGAAISKLQFVLNGHESKAIDIKDASPVQVVLKSAGTSGSSAAQGAFSAQLTTKTGANNELATMGDGGVIAPTHQKGELRGSQYLFKVFVHGFVVTSSGALSYNSDYLLDYDKLGGALLLTQDKKNIAEVGWDQTRSFTLYSPTDEPYTFEKAPSIDQSHYVQVLATGKKYKIYKLIKTRFVKSDYVNRGVVNHGTDYDEYIDDGDYYVWNVQSNQSQKLVLKKKSIKEGFPQEADKANKYVSDTSGKIDDAYLSKLGAYMNQ